MHLRYLNFFKSIYFLCMNPCFLFSFILCKHLESIFSQHLMNWWTGIQIKYEFIYRSLKLAPTPVPYRERLWMLLTDAQGLRRNGKKLQNERTAHVLHTIVLIPKSFCTIVSSIHTSIRHWRSVPLERI